MEKYIESMSQLFKSLSDPTRLKVLLLLQNKGECNVGEIATILGKEQSAISHQLKNLKEQRLIKSRREKSSIYYSLDDEHVKKLLGMTLEHIKHQ